MRELFHIMYFANSSVTLAVVVSLDIKKVFDHIEWPYLFKTRYELGFGPDFIKYNFESISS